MKYEIMRSNLLESPLPQGKSGDATNDTNYNCNVDINNHCHLGGGDDDDETNNNCGGLTSTYFACSEVGLNSIG